MATKQQIDEISQHGLILPLETLSKIHRKSSLVDVFQNMVMAGINKMYP